MRVGLTQSDPMSSTPLLRSDLPGVPVRRGKVRDVYDFGDRLLLVATDRISAFDWVLPTGIPDKGRVLTQISEFWFGRLGVPHHLLSMDPTDLPLPPGTDIDALRGRSMVVRKTSVVPIECVVRGYLAGSGWKEYRAVRDGLRRTAPRRACRRVRPCPEPIFTPATKAESGHDENISFPKMGAIVGTDLADQLRQLSLTIYERGAKHARAHGILIADTKFEFGLSGDDLILIDEVLTPDSSRFWPEDRYAPGRGQPSFDKQFVRDWLETTGWDKNSPPPELPTDVVAGTRAKYIEAYERLSGQTFAWRD